MTLTERIAARRVMDELRCMEPAHDTPNVAEEATQRVVGARHESYGPPRVDLARTGVMVGAILGLDRAVTPQEMCLILMAVKISRLCHRYSADSLIDICGYALCLEEIEANQIR